MPVPGYVAPDEGPTTEAAKAGDGPAGQHVRRGRPHGRLAAPLITGSRSRSRTARRPSTTSSTASSAGELPGDAAGLGELHGFTSLEAYGHLDWLEPEARDALFRSHIGLAAKAAGLPVPAP